MGLNKYIYSLCFCLLIIGKIQSQSISNLRFSGNHLGYCAGSEYTLIFDTIGTVANPNFQIQLSSSNGSFLSPIILSNTFSTSNIIQIPSSSNSSNSYAIRIVRLSPTVLISDTLKNLKISKVIANYTFSPNNACPNTDVSFSNLSSGAGKLNYNWVFNRTYNYGSPAARNDTNPVVKFNPFFGGGTVTYGVRLIVTDSFGCIDSMITNVGVKQRPLVLVSDSNIFAYPEFSNCQGNPSVSNPNFRLTVYNNCQVIATINSITLNWGDGPDISLSPGFTSASHVYNAIGAFNLIVRATNNNSCVSVDTFHVSNQLAPTLSLSGPITKQGCAPFNYPIIMGNYQNNSAGTYYTFDFDDGSPILRIDNPTTDTIWHTFNSNSCSKLGGAFVVKAKAHNLCDSTPATLGNFRIWTKPRSQFATNPDTTVCANTPVNISNNSSAGLYGLSCSNTTLYQWNFGTASPSNSSQATPPPVTFPSAGLFPVRLIATNPCGSDTLIKQICAQVSPLANFVYSHNPTSKCKNNTVSFSNTSNTVGSCGLISNKWSILDSNGILFSDTAQYYYLASGHPDSLNCSINFIKAGKYKIRLTVSNICGTSSRDTFIIIKDIPKVSLIDSTVYCGSQFIQFNGASLSHQVMYDSTFGSLSGFQWDILPNNFTYVSGNSNSKSPSINFPNTSTLPIHYSIYHYALNECGISIADTQVISILPSPTLTATANSNPVCSGAPVTISLSSNINNGVTYTWRSFANTGISGNSNQFSNALGPINQTIINLNAFTDTVTYRILPLHAASSCYGDSATFKLAVLPAVQNNSIQTDAAICEGTNSPQISGNAAAGGLGSIAYLWQKWNGSAWINAGGNDTSQNYSPGILYQTSVFRRLVNTLNCVGVAASVSNEDTVLVYLKPNVSAGLDLFKCKNDGLFNLGGTPSGGTWSGNGVLSFNSFNPSVMSIGTYVLKYYYTDLNTCSNEDSMQITIRDNPLVFAGNDINICENADSFLLVGFSPLGGIWTGSGMNTNGKFSPKTGGSGVRNMYYYYVDTNNCSNTDTLIVNVIPKPTANFSLFPLDSGCGPLTLNLNNTSLSNSSAVFSSLNFIWTSSNGLNDTAANQVYSFGNSGVIDSLYSVNLLVVSPNTCRDSVSKTIKVKPNAKAEFNFSQNISCAPFVLSPSEFSAINYPEANQNYIWKVNTTQIGTGLNFPGYTFYNSNDSFKVSLIALSKFSCKNDTFEKWFYTISNPRPDFIALDSITCSGSIIQFQNNSFPAGSLNYKWEFGTSTDTSNQQNPFGKFMNYGVSDTLIQVKLHAITISGCRDSITKAIRIKPLPRPFFSFQDTVICFPQKATVVNQSASQPILDPAGFKWSNLENLIIENDTSSSQTFVQLTDLQSTFSNFYRIQLTAKTIFGCTDSFIAQFRQAGRPFAGFSLSNDSACTPVLITTNNYSQNAVQYNWSSSNTQVSFTDNFLANPLVSVAAHRNVSDSNYSIRLIVKSIDACSDTVYRNFKAYPKPIANFISNADSGCADFNLTLKSTSTSKSPNQLFWNFGDGKTANSNLDSIQNLYSGAFLKDTTYHVSLILESSQGCLDTIFKPHFVKVKTVPKAQFLTNIDTSCSPLKLFVTNTSVGSPQYFSWDLANNNSSVLFEPTGQPITYTATDSAVSYRISLSVQNMCGMDSIERYLQVLPDNLHADFNVSAKVGCESLRVQFGDMSRGSQQVSWDFGDGFTSTERNPVHVYSNPGVYDAYQFVSNACFYDTSYVRITVLRKPNFSIEIPSGIHCAKQAISFNSNLIDTGAIKWYFGDGDSSLSYDPSHAYKLAGKYPVKAVLQSFINSCSTVLYDTISISTLPQVEIFVDTNAACFGHQFTFSTSSSNDAFYTWDLGDSNTISAIEVPQYNYTNPGQYLLKLKGVSIDGCKDSSTKYIQVWPVPTADFIHTPKDTCYGPANVYFTNLSKGADSYLWDFGNGKTAISKDAVQYYSGLGVYPIKLIVTNIFQCKDSLESTFEIMEQPFASFDFDDSSGCLPYDVPFINTSKGGSMYTWYFGDGDTSSLKNPTHTYLFPGVFYVSLVVKAGLVCRDSFTFYKPIRVDSKSGITFTSELLKDKKPYREVVLKPSAFNKFIFEWKFGDGSKGFGEEVFHRYAEGDSGCFNVELKVITTNNCDTFYTDTVCLPAYWEGLSVPNALSPDYGTEQVRVFKPAGVELVQYHIRIYNKWGEMVWESKALQNGSPAEGWNGNDLNGNPCMQGNYIWMIEAEFSSGKSWEGQENQSKNYNRRGTLTLIR